MKSTRSIFGSNQARPLSYRKQVKALTLYSKYCTFTISLLFLSAFFYDQFGDSSHEVKNEGMWIVVLICGLSWLISYFQYFFVWKPLSLTKVEVYDDYLTLSQGHTAVVVSYEDIVEVRSLVNKNIGGWFKIILKDGRKYRFSALLERWDYILDAIVKFNPNLMEEEEYKCLRNNLILADHNLARFADLFSKRYIWFTLFHIIFIPAIFAWAIHAKQNSEFIIYHPTMYFIHLGFLITVIYAVLPMLCQIIVNAWANSLTIRKCSEDMQNKRRDYAEESKIYRRVFPAYLSMLLLYFGFIYHYDLNTIGIIPDSLTEKFKQIKAKELYWYDSKYNCTQCNYPLKKGDLIVHGKFIGKIVALPTEEVFTVRRNKDGRFIASQKQEMVPKNNFAVQAIDSRSIRFIEFSEISGKIK